MSLCPYRLCVHLTGFDMIREGRETPSGSPVTYGGKPACSAGLTGFLKKPGF